MRRRPWDDEEHAAEIVCAQLGGIARKVDAGGGAEQLHDFDVELPDGRTIAVEVTRHNVPSSLAVLSEIDKRDWYFPQLRYDWVVDMIPTYDVGKVHGQIAVLLAAIEAAGIEMVHVRGVLFDATLGDDEVDDDEREDGMASLTGTDHLIFRHAAPPLRPLMGTAKRGRCGSGVTAATMVRGRGRP